MMFDGLGKSEGGSRIGIGDLRLEESLMLMLVSFKNGDFA
jgi:hypothetical protein